MNSAWLELEERRTAAETTSLSVQYRSGNEQCVWFSVPMIHRAIIRCLIADDCRFDRRYARSIVEEVWCEIDIQEARNVESTLCQLQQGELDLALLDNDMGDGTTLEAVPRLIGASGSHLPPLIMVSGNLDPALSQKALQAGFSGFISKDEFSEFTLREVVVALGAGNSF